MEKRNILKGILAVIVLSSLLISCKHTDSKVAENDKKLKILILGGTSFLGPHQIAYSLERGHSITTFTRGKTKPTVHSALFDQVEMLIGDREDNLSALETGEWDVVIDNSGRKVEWTKATANLLKDRVKLYVYTSSTGVYYPYLGDDIDENTTLNRVTPEVLDHEYEKMEYDYGVMKANSEAAVMNIFGKDRSLIIRPTYMIGPGDKTDRFIYWPIRLSRGGEVLVPGKAEDPVQYIDVRDVAEFMIRLAEDNVSGTYNVAGPIEEQNMREFVEEASKAFDIEHRFVYIDDYDFLAENGIDYLIPWIPPLGKNYGSARTNIDKALKAGLTLRPVEESVKDIYDWWYSDAVESEKRRNYEEGDHSILRSEQEIIDKWKKK